MKIQLYINCIISVFLMSSWGYAQSANLNPEYLNLIQQKIASYIIYPLEAKEEGWEGIVKVKFVLNSDGQIKQIQIAQSSGHPLLDEAAISAIKKASPYPFPKSHFKELEIILPINYQNSHTVTIQKQKQISLSEAKKKKTLTSPSQESEIKIPQTKILLPPEEIKNPIKPLSFPSGPFLPSTFQPDLSVGDLTSFYAKEMLLSKEIIEKQSNIISQELEHYIDLAIKNNQPTQVAREEIELAQIKVTEAQRNLFPAFKISTYTTEGDVYRIKYEERETKFEINQPLFYGGRLRDTLKQAEINLEITKRNYDRQKFDVRYKTETAYYNLIASRMHLVLKEPLRQEAKELLDKIERLSTMGMIIPLEVNRAKSWFEQIGTQIENLKHDLHMAELTFIQTVNLKELPPLEGKLMLPQKINIDPNRCLEAALEHRPEIYLSKLLTKFNEYAKKIEINKKKSLTVDLTSSYGFYEGHYKTEPWRDSSNWYAGIKFSKPLGASTINSAYTKEETQPRFGQTSPTGSSTLSMEFNLLDNFKRASDKKKADIDFQRSLSDFNETLKTIKFEVQEAIYNYQRALLQLNSAEIEMKFRRNETEITKIRALVGEISLSAVLETLFQLAEAQTRYIQALANYQISLANLRKATGYGINI